MKVYKLGIPCTIKASSETKSTQTEDVDKSSVQTESEDEHFHVIILTFISVKK